MQRNDVFFFSGMGMIEAGDKIWFASREINGLFQIDRKEGQLIYLGDFPEEESDYKDLYGKCIIVGEKIYFAPYNANHMAIYDMKKKSFNKISIKKRGRGFLAIIFYKENIILLPSNKLNNIIKISVSTNQIEYIELWKNELDINELNGMVFWDYCIKENVIYAPIISGKGKILKYEIENNKISYINTEVEQNFKCICCNEDFFYLTNDVGNILTILDKNFKTVSILNITEYTDVKIGNLIYKNGYVFIFTNNLFESEVPDMIVVFEVRTKTIKVINFTFPQNVRNNISHMRRLFMISEQGNLINAFNGGNGVLYTIDSLDLSIIEKQISINGIEEIYKEKSLGTNGNIQFWEKSIDCNHLEIFIDIVKNVDIDKNEFLDYGKEIWGNNKKDYRALM